MPLFTLSIFRFPERTLVFLGIEERVEEETSGINVDTAFGGGGAAEMVECPLIEFKEVGGRGGNRDFGEEGGEGFFEFVVGGDSDCG